MALQAVSEVIEHGGNLAAAAARFPDAPRPWLDLSTGINPHSYPLFELPATALTRLPEAARLQQLKRVAAAAYRAPSAANLAAAPGTQILLPLVAGLVPPGRAAIFTPTYAEHAHAARTAGHQVAEVARFEDLFGADLAIAVNPNNPDGRIVPRRQLLDLAADLRARGGMLVVDEAFMDVGPEGASVADEVEQGGLIVLRSFGKFFGLAGVRLGFAIAAQATAARLEAQLGPWAVAGPALEYGLAALADQPWQQAMRVRLTREAGALDVLLRAVDIQVTGGTDLFRFARHDDAQGLYETLGGQGILVRRFDALPDRLRIGLPAGEADIARLAGALASWAQAAKVAIAP
ncbi:MAG: threonine-phosphate decarboxylase [Rhizobiaceae bacterium]|nr:threonine-phosphate decarboxylase [Rhizobiaceae bacterium]